jgi:DivIVA domain-containing protein
MTNLFTPKDIDSTRFTTTRFREGYSIDEVDQFCDDARDTITALADDRDKWKHLAEAKENES